MKKGEEWSGRKGKGEEGRRSDKGNKRALEEGKEKVKGRRVN